MIDIRRTLAGFAMAAALFSGCVTDNSGPQRSAMWKSYGDGSEKNWLGREKKASPRLYVAEARLAEDSGDHDTARKSYQAALGSDPRSFDAIMGIARIDQLAGRIEDAEKGYEKALRMRPKDPAALDALGQFYASQNRWPEAIRNLNAAVAEAPNDSKKRFHLAVAMAKSGDVEGSLPHFAKTCGEAEAQYNVAWILKEKGDLVGAERHLLAAVVKRPDLAQAQAMLDEIQHTQGRDRILPASQEQPRKERRMPLPVDATAAAPSHAGSQAPIYRAAPQASATGDEQPFGAPPPRAVIHPQSHEPPGPGAPDTDYDSEPPPWQGNAAPAARGYPARALTEPEAYRPN